MTPQAEPRVVYVHVFHIICFIILLTVQVIMKFNFLLYLTYNQISVCRYSICDFIKNIST